jgi:outer membrane receptor protein involved in Fe transport
MEVREHQVGNMGTNNVLLSGMAGFAIKTKNSKYRINILHLQNGESKAAIFDYESTDQGSNFYGFQHNLEYTQRGLTNGLISGKHNFIKNAWEVEWKVSPTYSTIEDPDIRFTRYEDRDGTWSIGTEVGFPERIWRDLDEINIGSILHVKKDFQMLGETSKLLFGGAYTYKERDYVIYNYALNIRGDFPLTGDPDELFWEENLWPRNGDVGSGTTYEAPFIPNNPNQYNSNVNSAAAYVSTELSFNKKFKANIGVRMENFQQRYTGRDQQSNNVLDNDVVLDNLDFFPSINLIYNYKENQNLRLSYSMTVARPSFKELSYAEIYDPVTSRTFIGGLFRDADDVAGVEYWDGNLQSAYIHNFDLRWELFKQRGQLFSLSAYYKSFIKPIEIVQYATRPGAFQPRNVGDGNVYGFEAELRYDLDNFTPTLKSFRVLFNFTYAWSQIKLSKTEYDSRVENARTGQTIDEYRAMAGLAPYLINAGIAYNGGEKGFWQAFEAGIYYNVQGKTLEYVGIADRPDIYTKPFHSLNFNANKKFGKDNRLQLGLRVENILGSKEQSVYESYKAADRFFENLDPGVHFKLRFSYSLY